MTVLPAGWSWTKVKFLAEYVNGYPFAPGEWSDEGKPIIRIQNLTNQDAEWNRTTIDVPARYNVEPGDILIAWSASLGVHVWEKESALLNQHIFKATPVEWVDKGFFKWAAKWFIEELQSQAHGSTMQHLTKDVFGGFDVPLPPPDFQAPIANFLDDKTARIDALIAEKERLVLSVREYEQAELSRILTQGLGGPPTVLTERSFITEAPAHWRVTAFKRALTGLGQGWSPQCDGRPAEANEWGVLKVGCVNGTSFNVNENKALPASLEPDLTCVLQKGDVLVSRANTRELVGMAALVEEDHPNILICDKLYRLKLRRDWVTPEYAVLVLRSDAARRQIELGAGGASSSMQNISQDVIRELLVALPPLNEQAEIVVTAKKIRESCNLLAHHCTEHIARLREYRSSLISAAVTGQLDVGALGVTA